MKGNILNYTEFEIPYNFLNEQNVSYFCHRYIVQKNDTINFLLNEEYFLSIALASVPLPEPSAYNRCFQGQVSCVENCLINKFVQGV